MTTPSLDAKALAVEALHWYAEEASAARRHLTKKDISPDSLTASLTVLANDGGHRAVKALAALQTPAPQPEELREAVARIVEPRTWKQLDAAYLRTSDAIRDARAAACYAAPLWLGITEIPERVFHNGRAQAGDEEWTPVGSAKVPAPWPWEGRAWKPKSMRENLVRSGALIVAEIERLDRLAAAAAPPPPSPEAQGEKT